MVLVLIVIFVMLMFEVKIGVLVVYSLIRSGWLGYLVYNWGWKIEKDVNNFNLDSYRRDYYNINKLVNDDYNDNFNLILEYVFCYLDMIIIV